MPKTILVTGATDGIGLQTAIALAQDGLSVLLHGRSAEKLASAEVQVKATADASVHSYRADLSVMSEVAALAEEISSNHDSLDVLLNNAGVFKTANPETADGIDARFAVNTIAPWLLTQQLMPLLGGGSRVVNVSSAAQAPVQLQMLDCAPMLDDMAAYSQSKLAITMWSYSFAQEIGNDGPSIIAVNPGSLLGTKMVKEAFGPSDKDVGIGADILCRASVSDEFSAASGKYFCNDSGQFAEPHPDARDLVKCQAIQQQVASIATRLAG